MDWLRAAPLLVLCVAALSAGAAVASAPGLSGARRDLSGRFLNAAGPIPFAGPWITLPFFLRRAAALVTGRSGAAEAVANDGAFLRDNAGHSVPTVTWIGHSTMLVQMDHATFLTDPIWSERASPVDFAGPTRLVPPGVAFEDLPPIDFVLVSHDHYDHMDTATLRALAARDARTRFVAPLENAHVLRDAGVANVAELDWDEALEIGGVRVICVPAQHRSGRGPFDERTSLWASFAVVGTERRVFFAGDTGYHAGFAETGAALGPFDLAALPIGAYEPRAMMRPWHMNPEEAVQAGRDLGARRLVAMHYGTFDLADEPLDEPPQRFRAAAEAAGFDAPATYVLRVGETRTF